MFVVAVRIISLRNRASLLPEKSHGRGENLPKSKLPEYVRGRYRESMRFHGIGVASQVRVLYSNASIARDFSGELPRPRVVSLGFPWICDFHTRNISPVKVETSSTWLLHLSPRPVYAPDAAYGRLNGSREASHAMCLEHQPSTVASKRRKIRLPTGIEASLHRHPDRLAIHGRCEVIKTSVEALSGKEDQAIKGRQERIVERATGRTDSMTERAMPTCGMVAMLLTEAPGPREIAIEVLLTLLTNPHDPGETKIDRLLAFPNEVARLEMSLLRGIMAS